jgi:hypothetical protein
VPSNLPGPLQNTPWSTYLVSITQYKRSLCFPPSYCIQALLDDFSSLHLCFRVDRLPYNHARHPDFNGSRQLLGSGPSYVPFFVMPTVSPHPSSFPIILSLPPPSTRSMSYESNLFVPSGSFLHTPMFSMNRSKTIIGSCSNRVFRSLLSRITRIVAFFARSHCSIVSRYTILTVRQTVDRLMLIQCRSAAYSGSLARRCEPITSGREN